MTDGEVILFFIQVQCGDIHVGSGHSIQTFGDHRLIRLKIVICHMMQLPQSNGITGYRFYIDMGNESLMCI